MTDPSLVIRKLLEDDPRYCFEAYRFVFEALSFAQSELGYGTEAPQPSDEIGDPESADAAPIGDVERHLTGQQLCEALRLFALDQFGYMAKCVFNQWGIHSTGDFGEVVFNLIRIGQMRKTESDRREDFDDVFDFEADLGRRYQISPP